MALISIVFPVYNEQENIEVLYDRLKNMAKSQSEHQFEFVFVDDCSNDATPELISTLRKADPRVHWIRFARNAGSHAAITAGLIWCQGDAAVVMASDLQDPPEIIPDLLKEWENGNRIVWGVRKSRKGESLVTVALSRIFHFLMNLVSDVKQPPTGTDMFLIDRVVMEALKNTPEKNTSVVMLITWFGFSQGAITYDKAERWAGISKWTFSKRLKIFFDALISFSYAPLRFMSLIGVLCSAAGFFYAIEVLLNALGGHPVQGWSSLMIVVLFMGGFQMVMMGMLGEYLWRTYDESRRRPRYVLEQNSFADSSAGRRPLT
jgi:polyisoprenyl-phosphate glycosyltransferase